MSALRSAPAAAPWLARVPAYVPGRKPPLGGLALAANEAVSCSPAVATALARVDAWSRYPDPLADRLRTRLAVKHGVSPEQILVGNGSDELVQLIVTAFVGHGGTLVAADPPYAMSRICALVADGAFVGVPLVDFAHDLDAMAAVSADVAYVVNPHNPTGTIRSRDQLRAFVDSAAASLVVIDEAYVDFADAPDDLDATDLVADGRAVVMRTFSKAYGLAGFRVGYLVASEDVVRELRRVRAPFSVSAAAQAAAAAALEDAAFLAGHVHAVADVRARLTLALQALGAHVPRSHANFVLATGVDEHHVVSVLAAHGISVRAGSGLGVPGSVRITVPAADDLPRLALALREALHRFDDDQAG